MGSEEAGGADFQEHLVQPRLDTAPSFENFSLTKQPTDGLISAVSGRSVIKPPLRWSGP